MAVRNDSEDAFRVDPQQVIVRTTAGPYSPMTFHDPALMGAGVPGAPADVAPSERKAFILSGLCRPGGMCASNPLGGVPTMQVPGEILSVSVGGRELEFTGG
jgi:hypothetical protein